MALSDKPAEVTLVSCEVCRTEIPKSEEKAPEAVEYFVYFCGADCYDKWTNPHRPPEEHAEKSGS
jgi:hypothetical protein